MSRRRLKGARSFLATVALLSFTASAASAADDIFKSLRVSRSETGGAAAVRALGGNLAAVAAAYGKTPNELRALLLRDKTLKVAPNGRLFYKESAVKLPAAPMQQAGILDGALFPLSQTFSLHSKPGSKRLLILNFQGATITGTYWNSPQRPRIVATAFNTQGTTSTFSDGERTAIQQIWQRVAEDYAPFDVDVTTDINAVASAPAGSAYATVVITRQSDYNIAAPGVAYTSTFGNATYDPAFVAYDSLGGNPKYIAEAVSHELGHRLGLDHDGTGRSAYYAGHGTAPMTWAPIMGNSYSAAITQFSKGEYAGATNLQDDYATMGRYLAYRQDGAGDIPAQAANFPATASQGTSSGSVDGVLEKEGDVDLYTIIAAAGPLTASVTPAALAPDADLVLSLINDTGATVVPDANPATALNAYINTTLTQGGVYYLKVKATGYANPANSGYSSYGSRGNYRLTASYPASSAVPPRAAITASALYGLAPLTVNFDAATSSSSTPITSYAWDLGNGNRASNRTASATYATPGTYPVILKVGNAAGLSNQTLQNVTAAKEIFASVTVSKIVNPDGTVSATANVPRGVRDASGNRLFPVVYGTWSGAVTGDVSSSGWRTSGLNLGSQPTRNTTGCINFTVTRMESSDPTTAVTVNGKTTMKWMTYMTRQPLTASTCSQQATR